MAHALYLNCRISYLLITSKGSIMKTAKLSSQIKSKQRVADHGEVFTAKREVNAMVDLVEPLASSITATVLEPACGEGVFLIEVLNRRLETLKAFGFSGYWLQWQILRAVSSLYGVDIQADNVEITRQNLINTCRTWMTDNGEGITQGFAKALAEIVKQNIIAGDTLAAKTITGRQLAFSEWSFEKNGVISRMEYPYEELIACGGESSKKHRKYSYHWMEHTEALNPDMGVALIER